MKRERRSGPTPDKYVIRKNKCEHHTHGVATNRFKILNLYENVGPQKRPKDHP